MSEPSDSLRELAAHIYRLNVVAVEQYTPVVEDILHTANRDIALIEPTLDNLLPFCGYEPALLLYRRLCRHYYDIDPVATVAYVNLYREEWDSTTE